MFLLMYSYVSEQVNRYMKLWKAPDNFNNKYNLDIYRKAVCSWFWWVNNKMPQGETEPLGSAA